MVLIVLAPYITLLFFINLTSENISTWIPQFLGRLHKIVGTMEEWGVLYQEHIIIKSWLFQLYETPYFMQ